MPNYRLIKNVSGEIIPPFALMEQTGIEDDTGAIEVDMPSADSLQGLLVNGPTSIDVDDYGQGSYDVETVVKINTLVAYGGNRGNYGSKADQWEAEAGQAGLLTIGERQGQVVNAVRVSGEASYGRNRLVNGGFAIMQRKQKVSLGRFLTGNYTFDRWYTEHDGGNTIRFIQQAFAAPVGAAAYGYFFNTSGNTAAGVLLAQPLDKAATSTIKAIPHTFRLSAWGSPANVTVNMAVFEWNGVQDSSSCKKLVASWDANHTPTFKTANLTQIANDSFAVGNDTWHYLTLDFTGSEDASNVIAAFWVENLGFGNTCLFTAASVAPAGIPWIDPTPTENIQHCNAYYYAPVWNYTYATFTGNNTGGGVIGPISLANVVIATVDLPPMRTLPGIVHNITGPITDATNLLIDNMSNRSKLSTTATTGAGNLSISLTMQSDPDAAADSYYHTSIRMALQIQTTGNGSWNGTYIANGFSSGPPNCGDNLVIKGAALSNLTFDAEI